ncbi:TetR/AcrR family transcriptional regulator [Streptomyces sp. NPDC057027]|uniref:TetR/AcrR family transcriptional regulator n=1 Tax=Streptomyces sp. NPDC057027 TaxID=3346004 RepID=UPI003625764E
MDEAKRKPGRPNVIDRGMIVDAALAIEDAGRTLSMQAVADRLGVPRGTLYHHVADRAEMAALVAVARLDEALDDSWMPAPDADWRTWLTSFAHAMRTALLAHATPVDFVLLEGRSGRRQLAQVEAVLTVMARAGFPPELSTRCLTLLVEVVQAHARSVFVARASGPEQQRASLSAMLAATGAEFPLLRAGTPDAPDPDDQLAFDLDVVLAGIEMILGNRRGVS